MKLAKRIAALALTGVMAVVALTGCGGTPSSSSSTKTSTSASSTTTQTTEEAGLNKTAPAVPETSSEITLANSMYNEVLRVIGSETYYMKMSMSYSGFTLEETIAAKGSKWYLKYNGIEDSDYMKVHALSDGTNAYILELDTGESTSLKAEDKMAIIFGLSDEDLTSFMDEFLPSSSVRAQEVAAYKTGLKSIVAGSTTVSGKTYYSETVTTTITTNGVETTGTTVYCFEGNQLKYEISTASNGTETVSTVIKVDAWTTTVSDSLFVFSDKNDYTLVTYDYYKNLKGIEDDD